MNMLFFYFQFFRSKKESEGFAQDFFSKSNALLICIASILDDFISRYARNKSQPLRSADEYESD